MTDSRRPGAEQSSAQPLLSAADRRRLEHLGISEARVRRQVELLGLPPSRTPLLRPCFRGDGVRVLKEAEQQGLIELWRGAAEAGRLLKMVPASGAASRMFGLLRLRADDEAPGSRERLEALKERGDRAAGAVLRLLAELRRLPFENQLAGALAASGRDLAALVREGAYVEILDGLLERPGLGYGAAPKALISFHRYPRGPRTAFAEQLAESARYLTDGDHRCRLHFTISETDRADFAAALESARRADAALPRAEFQVTFSTQDPATDTVALTPSGELARDPAGDILLRPAGHGALLRNLEALAGDLVLVQNIDNVVPEDRQDEIVLWKRLLIGHTVRLESEISALRRRLETAPEDPATAAEVAAALTRLLALEPPAGAAGADLAAWAAARLRRPLRVCGVVPNAGEPGGGPFWVADADGAAGGQIVEPPEVDRADPAQVDRWRSSTHFNPVNMVLALRDPAGHPYPLEPLVDHRRYLKTSRQHEGVELRVLERPGLWNGSMAGWNTCFVELPISTFNPVKTVFDLLRPEHQPVS